MDGASYVEATVRSAFVAETERRRSYLRGMVLFAAMGFLACFVAWSLLAYRFQKKQDGLNAMLRAERDTAKSASNAKSMFLTSMSHELRTPLNAIIGYSEMLLENAIEDERQSDATDHQTVLGAAHSLLAQINDLFDLAKIEGGKGGT